ncbi:DUF5666 domain-containing protein [Asanoa sp. NPDC049573]|uniref:DUF5666 domain-containing protein n=1 Tax=Asanoa sp. NPDC049573 TaxID=3155396 RepID=UPI00341E2C46
MKFTRRKVLTTGSVAVAGGAAAVAVAGPAEAAPALKPTPGVSVVESVAGDTVTVRVRSVGRRFDGAARTVAVDTESFGYGWSLRPGDLVLVEEADGAARAFPLYRDVAGRVDAVDAKSMKIGGVRVRLDTRTLLFAHGTDQPVIGSTSRHLKAGDTVAAQCFDNQRDGALTVHFLKLAGPA